MYIASDVGMKLCLWLCPFSAVQSNTRYFYWWGSFIVILRIYPALKKKNKTKKQTTILLETTPLGTKNYTVTGMTLHAAAGRNPEDVRHKMRLLVTAVFSISSVELVQNVQITELIQLQCDMGFFCKHFYEILFCSPSSSPSAWQKGLLRTSESSCN